MRYSLFLLAALAGAAPALAENRAVVIGNADYRTAPDLAGSDTPALAEVMRVAGFVTAQGIDQPADELRRTLDLLARRDDAPGARIVALNGRFLNRDGETWLLGTDAGKPDAQEVGHQGVPLSLVMQLIAEAKPGAVLLLGTDQQEMPHREGLESGIGELAEMSGVSVIVGPPEATARALRELAAGGTVSRALSSARNLRLLPGGEVDLVPARRSGKPAPGDETEPVEADRQAWADAAEGDSAESYLAYLETYPSGMFAGAAETRRRVLQDGRSKAMSDRDAWSAAAALDRTAGYRDYLSQFPGGQRSGDALRRLAELAGLATKPISRAPSGIETMLGLDRAARLGIQKNLSRLGYEPGELDGIFGKRTREALATWQEVNRLEPTGYLTSAQYDLLRRQIHFLDGKSGRRDDEYWQRTGALGETRQLLAYLRRYPEGRHAVEAQRVLAAMAGTQMAAAQLAGADATWRWARRQDSAAAYRSYLERFPDGSHADEARQRHDNLQALTEASRREEEELQLNAVTRQRIESRLSEDGLDPGEIDGRFTDETRDALRRYQAAQNLRVTGYLSRQTVSRLLETAAPQGNDIRQGEGR
ncbi:peptidoglycan-binding protein [Paracoccus sp. KR1-242]|uniref:peptidoglycan-binding protein n=1 Tax=Paracoccus sp. KR1-242 TaxID=3410028 RepID=UPI003C03D710